jgi:hypothetical protein
VSESAGDEIVATARQQSSAGNTHNKTQVGLNLTDLLSLTDLYNYRPH